MTAKVDDFVELLPPLSRGLGRIDATPLRHGPRYIRTREMSRWHRVRSGVHFERWGHTAWHLWCGQSAHQGGRRGVDCLTAAEPVDGAPVCGTCQGRALGAGQEPPAAGMPELVFAPRRLTPPTNCPGSRSEALWEPIPDGVNVGRCLACGVIATVRVSGGAYNPRTGLVVHHPGTGLVPGCAFHAWNAQPGTRPVPRVDELGSVRDSGRAGRAVRLRPDRDVGGAVSAHIEVEKIPDGHVVVGYIAAIKVLDGDGNLYFASRNQGLNIMEALGMARDLADTAGRDVMDCGDEPL